MPKMNEDSTLDSNVNTVEAQNLNTGQLEKVEPPRNKGGRPKGK